VKAAWSLAGDVCAFFVCAVMLVAIEAAERHWGPSRPEKRHGR
jgi:hypothetical protein